MKLYLAYFLPQLKCHKTGQSKVGVLKPWPAGGMRPLDWFSAARPDG
jgi:hypothetical protein